MPVFPILTGLIGGLALFLFGTELIADGLKKVAAREVQQILGRFTRSRLRGMLAGVLVTVFLQTSAITTVLLVNFVSAGLMTLSQALGVVLGAAIGSTVTVQLIVFRVGDYALWLVVAGLVPFLFGKRRSARFLGQAVVGLGLVFFGVVTMAAAVEPIKHYPAVVAELNRLAASPALVVLVATLFTAVVQSSAGPVAIAISLASQGIIDLAPAFAVVLGANVGTTATGLISSLSSSREAKRVAVAHFLFKVAGASLFFAAAPYFLNLVRLTSGDIARQIANAHTLFNVGNMLLFLPLTDLTGRLLLRLVPEARAGATAAAYLDEEALADPERAFGLVRQETLRMASIIQQEMFPRVMVPLPKREVALAAILSEQDDVLDRLYAAIVRYLSRLNQAGLAEEQSLAAAKLVYVANDLEHVGDVAVEIGRQWRKLEETGLEFSAAGQAEMLMMFDRVRENFARAVLAFAGEDHKLARRVILEHPEILKLEKELRYSHFQRLQDANRWSLETSAVHTDLLNKLLQVNSHSVSIAQAILGII